MNSEFSLFILYHKNEHCILMAGINLGTSLSVRTLKFSPYFLEQFNFTHSRFKT